MEFLQELIQEEELTIVATESIVINASLHRLLYLLVIETLILGCQPRQYFFLKIKSYQLLGNTQKGFLSFLIYFAQTWNIVGSCQYKKQFNKCVKCCRTSFFIKYSTRGIRIVQQESFICITSENLPMYFSLVALSTPNFRLFNPCQEKPYMELHFYVLYFATK